MEVEEIIKHTEGKIKLKPVIRPYTKQRLKQIKESNKKKEIQQGKDRIKELERNTAEIAAKEQLSPKQREGERIKEYLGRVYDRAGKQILKT